MAIGGNHFIHAARRNIDLTAIVVNNTIYGMTGGQYSPTTPLDSRATTSPYGNIVALPDLRVAIAAGILCRPQHGIPCPGAGPPDRAGRSEERLQPGRGGQLLRYDLRADQPAGHGRRYDAAAEEEQPHPGRCREAPRAAGGQQVLCDVEKPEYIALYDQVIQRAQSGEGEKPQGVPCPLSFRMS